MGFKTGRRDIYLPVPLPSIFYTCIMYKKEGVTKLTEQANKLSLHHHIYS